ncbi:MAG: 3'-5' exonuclease [Candidatus Woesearchaeota archaeon]
MVLPYNYRSGKNIVDASNIVIMKNPNQINKHIKAFYENKDEKIFQYNALNDIDSANFIIDVTKKHYAEGYEYNDILLLYRRSRHIYPYKEYFKKHNFKINTKTIHGSKGLEAKIVFLIGMTTDGFPFVWEDSRVIQVIKKTDLLRKEEEERRIFYVAMTRAQERLILLSEKNNESSYCSDIPSDFKKVKVSKQEFTEEMLSPKLRGILQRLEDGQNPDEISIDLDEEQTNVEKYIARLIEMGLVDVKKFVNEKNYALIASEIPSDEQSPRLNPIKRALPKSISYGEIRYVIADWKHKQKE